MEEKTPESRRVDKALKKTQIPEEMAGTGRREKRYLMKIRHSAEQDFSRIMEIYSFARSFMAEHGNPNQWGPTGWPPEDLIHKDIREGRSYVCLNDEGNVIGTFFFTCGEDIEPTYRNITDGAWLDDRTGLRKGSELSASAGLSGSAATCGLTRTATISSCRISSGSWDLFVAERSMWKRTITPAWPTKKQAGKEKQLTERTS